MQTSRWKDARFVAQDALNAEIWSCSPLIHQEAGFRPADLAREPFTAQQAEPDPAILGERARGVVLPWVPDLLGAEWTHPEAVHVVGCAYAGFIRGLSLRRRTLPFADYQRTAGERWQSFMECYRRDVVEGDADYYEPIVHLLDVFGAAKSRFALFDLCRASLVPVEHGRSTLAQEGSDCLHRFVERPESKEWTLRRLEGSAGRMVLASGTVVEHGLLRLLNESGYEIFDLASGALFQRSSRGRSAASWVKNYAHPGLTLKRRMAEPTCWVVTGPGSTEARWFIVPVLQPQGANRRGNDPGYAKTVAYLEALKGRLRGVRAAVA